MKQARRPEPMFAPRKLLTRRIVTLSTVALILVLTMIGGTLWLSWQLQGAGAAINDAGSLRMRANAIALALAQSEPSGAVRTQIGQMNDTLDRLRHGNPDRPLFLPDKPDIRAQFEDVALTWHMVLEPFALQPRVEPYVDALPSFIDGADKLVSLIEQESARKTGWLRISQMALAALSCIGTAAIVYLLYLWFVVPVRRLQDGLSRIKRREFGARLPVESYDEFGQLAGGFNRMAAELQALYRDLEQLVELKTSELAAHNRELTALYEMAAFLNLPNDVEAICRGFIARLTRQFDADAATVWLISAQDDHLNLVATEGVSPEGLSVEDCMPGDAACETVVQPHPLAPRDVNPPLRPRGGFANVVAFSIASQGEKLGSFSLHFVQPRSIPSSEFQLLETLGKHLGIALKNRRLAALARQLAVVEERHLVAQGLHDSIAQGLNFLKMQVHLLDGAAREERMDEIREIVPLLAGGIAESYDDVRELLINFRTRLGEGELRHAVESTVARFRVQSGVKTTLDYRDDGGMPLPSDQQLQVLFILQEALSNVRKHAEARHVSVTIVNERDFRLLVEDDGQGYDESELAASDETHVGLHIMRERAERLLATLHLSGTPGGGARVELIVPVSARQAV